jgi:hypothetical protein
VTFRPAVDAIQARKLFPASRVHTFAIVSEPQPFDAKRFLPLSDDVLRGTPTHRLRKSIIEQLNFLLRRAPIAIYNNDIFRSSSDCSN